MRVSPWLEPSTTVSPVAWTMAISLLRCFGQSTNVGVVGPCSRLLQGGKVLLNGDTSTSEENTKNDRDSSYEPG